MACVYERIYSVLIRFQQKSDVKNVGLLKAIHFFYCWNIKTKNLTKLFFLNVWQYFLNSWSDRFVDNEKRIFKCPNIVNEIFFHSTTWWSIRKSTICIQLGVLFIFNLTCFFNDLKCNNDCVTNVRWDSFRLLFFFFGFFWASNELTKEL